MAFCRSSLSAVVPLSHNLPIARIVLHFALLLLLIESCIAQEQKLQGDKDSITVSAGTRFALVLTHPVDSRSMHRGNEIYAQTTAPITVGDKVAVPAGTFVQGRIGKLARKKGRAEFELQSLSLIFPDGFVAQYTQPASIKSDEGTVISNPSGSATAGAIAAPLAGAGLGALIGSTANTTQSSTLGGTTIRSSTHQGVAIGSAVGAAVGGIVSIVLLTRGHDFYVDVGSPMEMTLTAPLILAQGHGTSVGVPPPAAGQAGIRRNLPSTWPSADHGICHTPDIPGTPPTVIPGTPPFGDTPGTPDVVIPGTASIPGTAYPCP